MIHNWVPCRRRKFASVKSANDVQPHSEGGLVQTVKNSNIGTVHPKPPKLLPRADEVLSLLQS